MSVYYSKLKDLWEEFEALVPCPACNCERSREFIQHHQKMKLFQFLMGLNDSYLQTRSQILLMNPMPSVNLAYSMVLSDESQKSVSSSSGILGANPAVLQGQYDSAMYSRTGGNQKFKKAGHLYCDLCKLRNHTRENCYRIIGYPQDYKFKKKENNNKAYNVQAESGRRYNPQSQFSFPENQISAQNSGSCPSSGQVVPLTQDQMSWLEGCAVNKDQYQQYLQFLSMRGNATHLANTAGALQWEGEEDW